MKWLIIGGSGFLGRSFAEHALDRGHEVEALGADSFSPARPLDDSTVKELAARIRDWRPGAILHAVGSASVFDSLTNPSLDFMSSVTSWRATLEAVRLSGQRSSVLFPSSAAVYGNPIALPVSEDAKSTPISPYGWHKVICETLAAEYAGIWEIPIVVARLFSVLGHQQRRLLPWEIWSQLSGDAAEVTVRGTGQETRDFLHVHDVAEAFLCLASLLRRSRQPLVVNIASGRETSVRELATCLSEIAGTGKPIRYLNQPAPGDPLRWCADIRRLLELLPEFKPRSIEVALRDCANKWADYE